MPKTVIEGSSSFATTHTDHLVFCWGCDQLTVEWAVIAGLWYCEDCATRKAAALLAGH